MATDFGADIARLPGERETSELREPFIAVLGHDLRDPLASIAAGTGSAAELP
jgi:K+-sensing histidine kinase KdpD